MHLWGSNILAKIWIDEGAKQENQGKAEGKSKGKSSKARFIPGVQSWYYGGGEISPPSPLCSFVWQLKWYKAD